MEPEGDVLITNQGVWGPLRHRQIGCQAGTALGQSLRADASGFRAPHSGPSEGRCHRMWSARSLPHHRNADRGGTRGGRSTRMSGEMVTWRDGLHRTCGIGIVTPRCLE